jgi:hypothetical protein
MSYAIKSSFLENGFDLLAFFRGAALQGVDHRHRGFTLA